MKNKIEDLRNHIFSQLELLDDEELLNNPEKLKLQLQRASVVAELGSVIVESAKIEVKFLEVVGGQGTGFLPYLPEGKNT